MQRVRVTFLPVSYLRIFATGDKSGCVFRYLKNRKNCEKKFGFFLNGKKSLVYYAPYTKRDTRTDCAFLWSQVPSLTVFSQCYGTVAVFYGRCVCFLGEPQVYKIYLEVKKHVDEEEFGKACDCVNRRDCTSKLT